MKYNKIVSFALINGFVLLVFASVLSGCQKNSIAKKGHFTNYFPERNPANAEEAYVPDAKQIYLYCKLNTIDTKDCFDKTLTKILHEKAKEGFIESEQIQKFKDSIEYVLVEKEIINIANNISVQMEEHFTRYASKRQEFCDQNASKDLKRCLHRHLHADALKVLNQYQKQAPNLNGQEYLFLKEHFKKKFEVQFKEYVKTSQI
jgi:YHS domain-containing protein